MQKHCVNNGVHFDVTDSSGHVGQGIAPDPDPLDRQARDPHQTTQHGVLGRQRVQAA